MSPAFRRVAIIAGAAVILIVALVLLSGGSDKSTTSTTGQASTTASSGSADVPTVRVVGGKPQGGVQKLTFKNGDTVAFKVDVRHGRRDPRPRLRLPQGRRRGRTVSFSFPGKIDGRFVVELEGKAEQIAQLDVTP